MGIQLFKSLSKTFRYNSRNFSSIISSRNNHSRIIVQHRCSDACCCGADGKVVEHYTELSTENFLPKYSLNPPLSGRLSRSSASNGLLCLDDSKGDIVIWNPSTDESKFISPPSAARPGKIKFLSSWFEFDPKSIDYKVLSFSFINNDGLYSFHGELYSLKRDSWKEIAYSFMEPSYISPGCRVNGRHYWLNSSWAHDNKYILSFDFADEQFSILALPDIGIPLGREWYVSPPYDLGLLDFDGVLAIISYTELQPKKTYDMWVFKDGLWIREPSIRVCGVEAPLAFWGDQGRYLFFKGLDHHLKVFDRATGELKSIDIHSGRLDVLKIIPHVDTLVPLPLKSVGSGRARVIGTTDQQSVSETDILEKGNLVSEEMVPASHEGKANC